MPTTDHLSPLEIQLDPYNPRLSADEEGSDQAQLIKIECMVAGDKLALLIVVGKALCKPVM